MSKIQYKAVYSTFQYKPEFLEAYGKKQAELYRRLQRINDEMTTAKIEARYRSTYLLNLMLIFIVLTALLGAIIGLLIASRL